MDKDGFLIGRLSCDDEEAFSHIYKQYYSKLVGFSRSYTKDIAVAENLVQDAFTKLWENRHLLNTNTNLTAYLVTVTKNNTLNFLKRLKLQNSTSSNLSQHSQLELDLRYRILEYTNPSELFTKEIQELLLNIVNEMSLQTSRVLVLSRYEKKSNKEIADILNISVKGVEFHITKALKVLKAGFKDYLPCILFFLSIAFIQKIK